jgi:hypothetical protein
MTLSPEQKEAVAAWVAAGDNLSAIQKKLIQEYKLSLTYMDVRFLVDDLDLSLKDPAPKVSDDLSQAPAAAAGAEPGAADQTGLGGEPAEALADDLAPPAGNVTVSVDRATLLPGAMASGTVTFSDGVTGKWMVDNYGRPGFTEISQPGYRPSPADGQAFMQELNVALQKRGL